MVGFYHATNVTIAIDQIALTYEIQFDHKFSGQQAGDGDEPKIFFCFGDSFGGSGWTLLLVLSVSNYPCGLVAVSAVSAAFCGGQFSCPAIVGDAIGDCRKIRNSGRVGHQDCSGSNCGSTRARSSGCQNRGSSSCLARDPTGGSDSGGQRNLYATGAGGESHAKIRVANTTSKRHETKPIVASCQCGVRQSHRLGQHSS